MDRQKKKKIRNARVIMTNIFMALSVVALVSILTLVAMGYSFDKNGTVQQSGLAEIASRPSGATVEIDDNTQFERTKINKMLSSGKHSIKVTKSGYDTWQRDIQVDSGLLTNIDWIRLFPVQPEITEVAKYSDIRLLSFSSNRKSMFIVEDKNTSAKFVDLQDGEATAKKIKLATILDSTDDEVLSGTLSVLSWNADANRLVLGWTHISGQDDPSEVTHYYLVDLKNPEKSVDLTAQFNLTYSRILLANDSASKLWVVENQSLRSIDVTNLTISGLIATNVELITNDKDVVAFVNTVDGVRAIRVFKEGETDASVVAELSDEQKDATITLAMGTYWGDNWLSYTIDKNVQVLSGTYPSFDKSSKSSTLKSSTKFDMNFVPSYVSTNEDQRIIVFASGKQAVSIDLETNNHYNFETDADFDKINWLDEYLIWQKLDDKIIVRDFDGHNRREIISSINNQFGVLITENNNWLYYFDLTKETAKKSDDADQATNCASGETNAVSTAATNCISETTETTQTYTLKREKLKI